MGTYCQCYITDRIDGYRLLSIDDLYTNPMGKTAHDKISLTFVNFAQLSTTYVMWAELLIFLFENSIHFLAFDSAKNDLSGSLSRKDAGFIAEVKWNMCGTRDTY